MTGVPLTVCTQLFSIGISLTNNTGIFSLFMTVSVIVSYMVDVMRYNQVLNPFAVIGSVLIVSGISMAILLKDKIRK
jgi:drug/metabolite transporter (DMT)-like permease